MKSREDAKEWLLELRRLHDQFLNTCISRHEHGFLVKDPVTLEFRKRRFFIDRRLRSLGMSEESYYRKMAFEDQEIDLICPKCGKPLTFMNMMRGFRKCCEHSPECKGYLESLSTEIKMSNPETRELCLKNLHTEETNKKRLESLLPVLQSEEYGTKMSESIKRRWERADQNEIDKMVGPGRYKKSRLYSELEGKFIKFDSSWEEDFYLKYEERNLEFSELRRSIGFKIKYYTKEEESLGLDKDPGFRAHNYIPDFKAITKSGEIWIIEIKPLSLMDDEIVKAKIKYAIPYCKSHGYRYVIFNDDLSTPHFYY